MFAANSSAGGQEVSLPSFDDPTLDVRGVWIGSGEAGRILGVQRAQAWRLAKRGELPYIVTGTERRPIFNYRREDVERLKVLRSQRRVSRPIKLIAPKLDLGPVAAGLRRLGAQTLAGKTNAA